VSVEVSCFVCGTDLGAIPTILLVESRQAVQCPASLELQVRDSDLVFRLCGAPLARLGRVVITRAAAGALAESGQAAVEILARHAGCDHSGGSRTPAGGWPPRSLWPPSAPAWRGSGPARRATARRW
jgi:hypothetical protein